MTPEEHAQKCRRILARLPAGEWTPMMRFAFLDWMHADYEALDALLLAAVIPTRRRILPSDNGILDGGGREIAPPSAAPPPAPPSPHRTAIISRRAVMRRITGCRRDGHWARRCPQLCVLSLSHRDHLTKCTPRR